MARRIESWTLSPLDRDYHRLRRRYRDCRRNKGCRDRLYDGFDGFRRLFGDCNLERGIERVP